MIRDAVLHSFDWTGRARRRDLWAFAAFVCVVAAGTVFAEIWFAAGSPKAPRFVFLMFAVLLVPLVSLGIRRMHDRGHAGGWLVLGFMPWVCVPIWAYLLLAPTQSRADAPDTPLLLHLTGAGLVALMVLLVASRVFWAPYWIPSGSMKPALLVGDYVIARYISAEDMQRGDVVVFRNEPSGAAHMARLIGLPGDTVQMRAGQIMLNGLPVPQAPQPPLTEVYAPQGPAHSLPRCGNAPVGAGGQCVTVRQKETLPEGATHDVLDLMQASAADETSVFAVPQGQYFLMGDNRDDSLDSRFAPSIGGAGYVAASNVIARANRVVFSAAGSSLLAFWNWRADRFWQAVP